MRDLTPRARWLCAMMTGPRFRGGKGHHTPGLLRAVAATWVVGFALSQSACPLVGALSHFVPTTTDRAAPDASESDTDCPPCQVAGNGSCWDELLRWIEAQFTGDETVPFPVDECFDESTDAGNA